MGPWSSLEAGQKHHGIQEENKSTFFSPSENWFVCAIKPEEQEFVVDSGASMQWSAKRTCILLCWKLWRHREVRRRQRQPMDARRRHRKRQGIGKILDNDSPRGYASSIIARKASRWVRILIRVDLQSKTTYHSKRYSDTVQHGELRSDRGSWSLNESFLKLALFNIHDTFKEGNWSSCVFLKFVNLTNHDIFNCQAKVWGKWRRRRRPHSPCWQSSTGFPWRSGCRAQSTARSGRSRRRRTGKNR